MASMTAEQFGRNIQIMLQNDLDAARAKGYAAGLEEAAECAEQHGSTPGQELAETIRALVKKD